MSFKNVTRICLYVVLGLAVLLLCGQLFVLYYMNNNFITNLKKKVNKETEGKYRVEIGNATLNIFTRSIALKKIDLIPVKCAKCSELQFRLAANELSLSGIDVIRLFTGKSLHAESMGADALIIKIYRTGNQDTATDGRMRRFSLYKLLQPRIIDLEINSIEVEDSHLAVYNGASDTAAILQSIDNDISINKFVVNKHVDSLGNVFLSREFGMKMKSFSYRILRNLYNLDGKNLYVNYTNSIISIDSVAMVPRYSKGSFNKAAGHRASRVAMKLSDITFTGINPKLFLERGSFLARKLEVANMNLDVYFDLNAPKRVTRKPSVQEIMRSIPFPVKIDTVYLRDSYVSYAQRAESANEAGKIDFRHVHGNIINAINDSTPGIKNVTTMNIYAKFMGEGELSGKYEFSMNTRDEVFKCDGKIGAMSLKRTSNALKNLLGIAVAEGQLDSARFSFSVDGKHANGWLKLLYHDFKVEILDKNKNHPNFKDKVLSFLANTFVVRDRNPEKGRDPRVTKIDYEWNHNKYLFFNTWKALQSAVLPAIGIHNPKLVLKNPKK